MPDDAYTAITGDDKTVVKTLKTRNKAEREGQTSLDPAPPDLNTLAHAADAIDAENDDTLIDIARKQERHRALQDSTDFANAQNAADSWCAAFVAPKAQGAAAITTDTVLRAGAGNLDAAAEGAITETAGAYGFFHSSRVWPQPWCPTMLPSLPLRGAHEMLVSWLKVTGRNPQTERFGARRRPTPRMKRARSRR